jgi:uncharacterized protein
MPENRSAGPVPVPPAIVESPEREDIVQDPSNRLDPRVRLVWWTSAGLGAAAVLVAAFVAAAAVDPFPAPLVLVVVPVLALATLGPHLGYRRWRYEIRVRDVYLKRGFLFARFTLIPFDRIQYVENRQGPLDRLFGLTQVIIYTAAGPSGKIPGLDVAEAEAIREELSKVAPAPSV